MSYTRDYNYAAFIFRSAVVIFTHVVSSYFQLFQKKLIVELRNLEDKFESKKARLESDRENFTDRLKEVSCTQ